MTKIKTEQEMTTQEYVLFIDAMTTMEFCDWQKLKHPSFTGEIKSSAEQFVNLDLVKLRLIKEHAKSSQQSQPKVDVEGLREDFENHLRLESYDFDNVPSGSSCVTIEDAILVFNKKILPHLQPQLPRKG